STGAAAAVPAGAWKARRRPFVPAAVAVVLAAGAFMAGRNIGRGGTAGAGASIESFQQITDTAGVETSPTLSPDGKTVVFESDRGGSVQIYTQRVGSRTATALTSGPDNSAPAFASDGERIAFRSERDGGGVFLMAASGESVTRVADEGYSPSWSPNGNELVLARGPLPSPNDVSASTPGLIAVEISSGRKREVLKGTQVAMQPAWSPHGQRIAFFALQPGTGQRDIFTVAADGSAVDAAPIEVTNDPPLDWNPVWSPDGGYLYFSSNRGGTMNLWRVAINEATGKTLGTPEAVTTPAAYAGRIAFSRDGAVMAYASLDWRSTLLRQPFDPVRGQNVGPPTPMIKSTRPIRDHAVSPDGQWVVFNETTPQEDLIVSRVDGREYRRLTDDPARDRGPAWAPDGQTIYFYSDRSGRYELWKIRPDGSPPQVMTKDSNSNFPVVSPDGRRVAISGVSATGMQIRDTSLGPEAPNTFEPAPGSGEILWPFSWSRDDRLLGIVVTSRGTIAGVSEYDVARKQYRVVPAEYRAFVMPRWLQDGRRFLIRGPAGIDLVDAATGARRQVTAVRGYMIGGSLGVSTDGTWYSYTETGTEGDIWIARISK
ncbi:MAG TPA: hypothetical protein VLD67_15410, partial [Vicinamibacterales bacterium]|nr:hypothetical protein [Vicinamibacterales bacterium]